MPRRVPTRDPRFTDEQMKEAAAARRAVGRVTPKPKTNPPANPQAAAIRKAVAAAARADAAAKKKRR